MYVFKTYNGNTADIIEKAKQIVGLMPEGKFLAFTVLYHYQGVMRVDGLIYPNKDYGAFTFIGTGGKSFAVKLENGVYTRV